eukprot:CAMPEP_0202471548 /NCGR_PEP_ID=MMETSP1360-20130828/85067_1 /ASSEMBLY_ACC=CAM_ASM_000848 /TAXON_ID=515479 /ORGANISM="Licmophora paradoxa, Strain CCMP2313" /LENGTH=127 /DNA_ID=CAMNT_0049097709 /DNA_START=123 /DNA_END=506 /DNA_ORIENTATION=-
MAEYVGEVRSGVLADVCFQSIYVFHLLRNGYGFRMDDHVTATEVIGGQQVSWALGAMMYEINTLPWTYESSDKAAGKHRNYAMSKAGYEILAGIFFLFACILTGVVVFRRRRGSRHVYQAVSKFPDI